jgi:hypothetical protein
MRKKLGWGSLSTVLFILAVLFSSQIGRTFCLGDIVLEALGIDAWSVGYKQGFHNTIYYSAAFSVIGYVLGRVFKNDYGAKTGRRLCLFAAVILALFIPFVYIPG